MHEKNLTNTLLLDFYGSMLTEKQRDTMSLYYDEDLSLGEIAEQSGVSRQAVRDSIKKGEAQLWELEEKLGHIKRHFEISMIADKIGDISKELLEILEKRGVYDELHDGVKEISELASKLTE